MKEIVLRFDVGVKEGLQEFADAFKKLSKGKRVRPNHYYSFPDREHFEKMLNKTGRIFFEDVFKDED